MVLFELGRLQAIIVKLLKTAIVTQGIVKGIYGKLVKWKRDRGLW